MRRLFMSLFMFFVPLMVMASDVVVPVTPTAPVVSDKFLYWWAIIITVLFGVSEALSAIPAVKANSIYQLIYGILKSLAGKN